MNESLLPITTNEQGVPVVSTVDFAEGLGIQHTSLIATIQAYLLVIEKDFGQVGFQIGTVRNSVGALNQFKYAYLTEDQSLFIGSLSRNSERVVEFKSVLVRSFAEARKKLAEANFPSYQIADEIERAKRWIEEQKQVRALQFENAELKPKAEYAEQVLLSETELTTTKVAIDLGMSARKLNKLLQQKGVQYKQSGIWILRAAYNGKGYAKLRTYTHLGSDGSVRTEHLLVWTEVGRQFIHSLLNPALSTPVQLAIA
ncbi:phage antirepressor KilAC domain-containing protein [Spirosoma sp. SC4-14]|uniref:phage antirepressor KilAC domain-containing protein n=1 Tax=Spirosoma sp. SC4-14 TaxID=3128900 RepID=UPI0030D583A3